jgi:hypothetical protein
MYDGLSTLSVLASQMIVSAKVKDSEQSKLNIFFPFIDYLGYDITSPEEFISNPCSCGDLSFDYGLIDDFEVVRFKAVIKVVPFGLTVPLDNDHINRIIWDNVKYLIITDCFIIIFMKISAMEIL